MAKLVNLLILKTSLKKISLAMGAIITIKTLSSNHYKFTIHGLIKKIYIFRCVKRRCIGFWVRQRVLTCGPEILYIGVLNCLERCQSFGVKLYPKILFWINLVEGQD